MANFCAPCVVELFGPDVDRTRNDFAGWLTNLDELGGWDLGLCEGCGTHLFDNAGERHCGNRTSREALDDHGGDIVGGVCRRCRATIDHWHWDQPHGSPQ